MRKFAAFFMLISSLIGLPGCSGLWEGFKATFMQTDTVSGGALQELYLELQRRYSRNFDRNGYALQFGARAPNTIIIRLEYRQGSPEQALGFQVLAGARQFVSDLASQKYQIAGLQIETETKAVEH